MQVFVSTSPFKPNYYANSAASRLDPASGYTPDLMGHVRCFLDQIYRPGLAYKRAGVVLSAFVSEKNCVEELFQSGEKIERKQRLMDTVDQLNAKVSEGAVYFAREGTAQVGSPKQASRSDRATTRWGELLSA